MVKKILLIDDEQMILESLTDLLEHYEYEVYAAESAEKGLELFDAHTIDLVIADIFMPEINGFEFIRMLKKKHPYAKVIAISGGSNKYGFGDFDYLDHIKNFGVEHAFYKPVDTDRLIDAIEKSIADQNVLSPADVANIT